MRGEHEKAATKTGGAFGSSPHARGAPAKLPRLIGVAGVIPACAGSTSTFR